MLTTHWFPQHGRDLVNCHPQFNILINHIKLNCKLLSTKKIRWVQLVSRMVNNRGETVDTFISAFFKFLLNLFHERVTITINQINIPQFHCFHFTIVPTLIRILSFKPKSDSLSMKVWYTLYCLYRIDCCWFKWYA